ncbi:Gfo/Idh/MocA family oxidoreductase [Paenibacillus hunanensis]|uniref:Gfo/Idh/MocA family protein n=1 Tax=Paenibacillus hunanensis TaxID=539262 RepID=UPI0020274EB8|nr:Gfo/Idh/MocA family oxidoreductase [Paenibacillus hunanensis]MCL9661130.1 Gfo/Idh/MocA family oxidoreductase [Paenibacillus hunanensis]
MSQPNERKLNWGVVGTGGISNKFIADLPFTSNGVAYAASSRSMESAEAFVQKYNMTRAYDDYDKMLEDPELDAVYVGTPHPLHKENVLKALHAGKHVLCEKPFTINAGELEEMITLAREKKLFLMEGMWTRFLPPLRKVREWIRDGRIGEVLLTKAEFGFRMPWEPEHRLLNPELGGGALLDTGIYPVSFASMIFGAQPEKILSTAHMGETGVDEQFSIILGYSGGRTATLNGSIRILLPNEAYIHGTEGYIHIPQFLFSREASLYVEGEEVETFTDDRECEGYAFEAEEAGRLILEGKLESDVMPLDESLAIMRILDEVRAQWGFKYSWE